MKRCLFIFGIAVLALAAPAEAELGSSTRPAPPASQLPAPTGLKTAGFFVDLAAAAVGHGLDDPARLPPGFRELWDNAVQNELNGNLPGTLTGLHNLYTAFSTAPHGMERLEAVTRREKQEPFGQWMAIVHADLLATTVKTPNFDLRDIPDIERPFLIGIFKERTGPALEPLKTYFPAVDDKTGKPGAFTPEQLSGITVANAIEVKHEALYASATLLAQITLEPDMPNADRQLLRTQIQEVRRILMTASSLEPAAKAALAQAEREKRLADLRARQDAARHPALTPPANNSVPLH